MAKYIITASNDTQSSTFTVESVSEASAVRTIADGWTVDSVEQIPVLLNGQAVDFDAAVSLMDDELREHIHSTIETTVNDTSEPNRVCTDQEFIDAYAAAHKERFGKDFQVA